jgi:outer membrane lipoprotein-sorting protein
MDRLLSLRRPLIHALIPLLLCLWGFSAASQEKTKDPNERLAEVIKKVREVQDAIETLKVRFIQTNQFKMLKDPQIMEGDLVLEKPSTALYKYDKPSPLFFRVKDGALLVYNPKKKEASVQDIRRHEGKINQYLDISKPLHELQKNFAISLTSEEKGVVHLTLIPIKKKIKKKIHVMNFFVESETGLIRKFEIVDHEGDAISFAFSDWEINPELTDKDFEVSLPDDVKIKREKPDLSQPFGVGK